MPSVPSVPRFIVGIDLGTTHLVVAFIDPDAAERPDIFSVPRRTDLKAKNRHSTLPSVLYTPLDEEKEQLDEFEQRDNEDSIWLVGDFAEHRGREMPGRAISSAKSWLCHPAVDRRAPLLPWGMGEDTPKLSPVQASARLLSHVRTQWNQAHPSLLLEHQQVVLTVPASFDPAARQLTLEAAQQAGLTVRLLEEPQAAFYDYLSRQGTEKLEARLNQSPGELTVLVCDVGGGTTDLALLSVRRDHDGALDIVRTAVGRHLLLGGDNMDLALAHRCELQLQGQARSLDPSSFAQLVIGCRAAKEALYRDPGLLDLPVAVASRGASLVGQVKQTRVSQDDLREVVEQGFFPEVGPSEPPRRPRAGLMGAGLPYETDPAITRHVSAFLDRHLGEDRTVDALLLNGGVFSSRQLVERLLSALKARLSPELLVLPQPAPHLAVALGAAVYGLSLQGRGISIGGGSAHGYYVAVDGEPKATERRALCVVPRGSRESEVHRIASQKLALRLGVPVRFELYSSDSGPVHAPGDLVPINEDFELLPPIAAELGQTGSQREVSVVLEGELSAIGTLDIACVAEKVEPGVKPERYALAFELRGHGAQPSQRPSSPSGRSGPSLEPADLAVQRVFGKGRGDVPPREVKDLLRNLEKLLGPRAQWSSEVCRRLFDVIGPKHKARRRSVDHERLYWMLAGFTLRPGFGHPLDRTRIGVLTPLFEQGLTFPTEIRGWQQFFIAWRRVLGGLTEAEQESLTSQLLFALSGTAPRQKKGASFAPLAEPELVQCASFLERLPQTPRTELGEAMLKRAWARRDPGTWLALGRIGARVPVYASLHYVLPPSVAEAWLEQLLKEPWESSPLYAQAAAHMARQTGDRARDINESLRVELVRRMQRAGASDIWVHPVEALVPVEDSDRSQWFGDELPVGLRWVT